MGNQSAQWIEGHISGDGSFVRQVVEAGVGSRICIYLCMCVRVCVRVVSIEVSVYVSVRIRSPVWPAYS